MSDKLENKYIRTVPSTQIDVYDVLVAFNVTCPARAHAIKKLLCSGIRGAKDEHRDLIEAIQAIDRSIEIVSTRDA